MTKNESLLPVVARAAAIVGGVKELSKKLCVSSTTFYAWDRVPGKRVIQIEEATGGKVTRHELRPDLYPIAKTPVDEEDVRRILREELPNLANSIVNAVALELFKKLGRGK